METIKLIGRSSRLSLLQIDIVRKKIQSVFPQIKVEVIARSSKGDALQDIPLHTVEGSDFFTQDIFDALANGEADIAVHSLKDMSSEHFFGKNRFAVVDRDDARDVVIFSRDIEEKLRRNEVIIIGTCSPRREEMATVFLKKSLPQLNAEIRIETRPIRGNVETRLKKLNSGEYDATILATAGLNRLLRSGEDAGLIRALLADKKLMLLPMIECVPAPCQGAIVAEAVFSNEKAIKVLERINDKELFADCDAEKKEAVKYGVGCIQRFGVTSLHTRRESYLYASGRDAGGTMFEKWDPLPDNSLKKGNLFSSTAVMKDFFEYEWNDRVIKIEQPVLFVANYKSLQNLSANEIKHKTILVSGTKTWLELAKQGYWVTGSADALGFEFLLPSLKMPLLGIDAGTICIITNAVAAERWKQKGYNAIGNYSLKPTHNRMIKESIASADAVFWSSYPQFEFYGEYSKQGVKHLCAGGETAELLKRAGIDPVIFPTIKSFEQWKLISGHSHSAA